jgi:LmbE family N-acetylglucosaminyl deacetylase
MSKSRTKHDRMNVLVIAPHPDDEVIGCGGSLCLHADRGDRVVAVFLTSGELGLKHLSRDKAWAVREREAELAARILGLADIFFLRLPDWSVGEHLKRGALRLGPILKRQQPGLIYLPHEREWHPDHRITWPLVKCALSSARLNRAPLLRSYEVWTPLPAYDHVQNISTVMPRKLRALRTHRSQLGEFDYVAGVKGLNQFRGALAGKCRYAEVFGNLELRGLKQGSFGMKS